MTSELNSTIIFDIETTPLPEADHLWLITLIDLHEEEKVCAYHDNPELERTGTIEDGLQRLASAKKLVGHNIQGFDLPRLEWICGFKHSAELVDTLVASRLVYSDLREKDYSRWPKGHECARHTGSHSLGAWGHRLEVAKGDYTGDFLKLDEEMLVYGKQDVVVTLALYKHLEPRLPRFQADGFTTLQLEQAFSIETEALGKQGVCFDVDGAEDLLAQLYPRKLKLEAKLAKAFPPKKILYAINKRTGKRAQRRNSEGQLVDYREEPFNPGSRLELARRLQSKYGWVPSQFTDDGKQRPAMVEEIMLQLADMYEEAKWAAELYIVNARIGILEEGRGSYLNLVKDGRIHARTMHIGTITHRCSHSRPNLGNPTSVRKPWGKEIRSLFKPEPGMLLIGGDASGLEQRMLAHYLGRWDGGRYAAIVDSGDIHSMFMEILHSVGIEVSRPETKTIEYAWLYGAGDDHLGRLGGGDYRRGRLIRASFAAKIEGMKPLLREIEHFRGRQGAVKSLDGRRVATRAKHSALNSLLQSAGAVVMRWQFIFLRQELEKRGLKWGQDYIPCLHVHDEVQGSIKSEHVSIFTQAFEESFKRVGDALNLRVPLRCEVKTGNSWLETH